MGTTRWYVDQSGTGAGLGLPWSPAWYVTPGTTYRRLLTTTRPTTGNAGGTAAKPSPLPNSTAALQGITPALAGGSLVGSFRAVFPVGFIGTAAVRAILRVVSPAGVTRGTLADVTMANFPSSGSNFTRLVSGPLAPVVAVAGDRVVVEVGFQITSGLGGSAALQFHTATPTGDYAYTDGVAQVSTSAPWVELILSDPPAAPTGLTATAGLDTADMAWTAALGDVSGYDVRVDGGAPTAVGNVTAYTVTGLGPLTTYTLEVRATGPAGSSAWVPVSVTTLAGADYRAVVRLGSHTWDVLAGDPPAYGPTLPVSFGWAVPEDSLGFPSQPDPELANLELVTADAADMAGVDIGTTMRVSIYPTSAPTARPLATFRGRVADLEASPHPLGLSWRVLGVGYTADPGARPVGTNAWPQESGDARAARVMAEAGYPGWAAPAIGTTWEARNPSVTTARAELENISAQAVTNEGTVYGPNRRVLVHPVTDAAGELAPAGPFAGAAVLARVDALDYVSAGLVNRATTWRRTKLLDATWVRIDHPGGPTTYGDTRGPAYPPPSVQVLDPSELADMILDTTPGYRWLTGQPLRLEVWADQPALAGLVSGWFYRDPASAPFPWAGRAVIVQGITQTPDGSDTYAGMLAAATLRLEHTAVGGRLVVEFRLRPEIPAHSTVTVRWMDEDPALTWADEPDPAYAGPTWFALRTQPRP